MSLIKSPLSNFVFAGKSANQVGVVANDTIIIDVPLSINGPDVVLAGNQFTLRGPNGRYHLQAWGLNAVSGEIVLRWFDVTQGAFTGKASQLLSVDQVVSESPLAKAEEVITTPFDLDYELRVVSVGGAATLEGPLHFRAFVRRIL